MSAAAGDRARAGCGSSSGSCRRSTRRTRALAGERPSVDAVRTRRSGRTSSAGDPTEAELRAALAARRRAEIDRGLTLVGPHRDEWRLTIDGLDARHQASQGEQRTLALALRLAGTRSRRRAHRHGAGAVARRRVQRARRGTQRPRSCAICRAGQTLLTTAGTVPPDVVPEQRLRIHDGRVESERTRERGDEPGAAARRVRATVGKQLGLPAARCVRRARRKRGPRSSEPTSRPRTRVRSVRDGECVDRGRRTGLGDPAFATSDPSLERRANERCRKASSWLV